MHVNVKERLINEVVGQIKQWQKENYHKSMMQLKEKKEFEDAFKKVGNQLFDTFFLFSDTLLIVKIIIK